MLYLIGGAPRAGKSILGQRIAAKLRIGWISTDLLMELLRMKGEEGVKTTWNAAPKAVADHAEWFYPYLERFAWSVSSQARDYLIEGVDFLPSHVARLAAKYPIVSVFLGCSKMTLERFDRYPGKSRGYAGLPEDLKAQIVQDVPLWSDFIQKEAQRFNCPYVDTAGDFSARLDEARNLLIADSGLDER